MIRKLMGELDTAIHRPRVHHDRVVFGETKLRSIQPESCRVFSNAGEAGTFESLHLNAQRHDDVRPLERLAKIGIRLHAQSFDLRGQHRRRAGHTHLGA